LWVVVEVTGAARVMGPRDVWGAARPPPDALLWALLGLRNRPAPGGSPEDRGNGGVDPHGWLSGSPLNHTAVYQATGMIMVQLALSPPAALSRLRASAFVQGRPIDGVAREVVARRLRFDEEER
jgi:hypothetical protein